MKKLIAISVIFALVAGAAFAEATLGGQLMIGTTLLRGDAESDDIMMGGMGFHEAKIAAVFGDSKGGGLLKIVASDPNGTTYQMNLNARDGTLSEKDGTDFKNGSIWPWGFLYWQPNAKFRMQVGLNGDGDFGAAKISGWGFVGEAKNSVAAMSDYMDWNNEYGMMRIFNSALTREGNAFYPGTGDLPNINFSLFPIDGMRINFVLPIGSNYVNGGDGKELEIQDQIADLQLNVVYNFEDLGQLNVSFVGRGGLGKDKMHTKSVGNLYASFYLTALGPLKLDIGLVQSLPWYSDPYDLKTEGWTGIGLGLLYDPGAKFTFKFRTNVRIGGWRADVPYDTVVYAHVLPCYKVTNNLWVFFYAGMNMILSNSGTNEGESSVGWFVNPYIWVRAAEGLRFWTGVQIYQSSVNPGTDAAIINWRVPFGFNFYF